MPLSVPSGPFAISTLTLEVPARKVQSFSPSRFRLQGKEVFKLQTVLVTLFYPISQKDSAKDGISWLPAPKMKSIEGLVRYAGLNRYFSYPALFILPYHTRLPYSNDAPLAIHSPTMAAASSEGQAPASATGASDKFPVGIFSHGLAGSKTTYSQYLAELASQGMIIASVEHRDGSGPATTIEHGKGKKEETLMYFKHQELDKDEQGNELGSLMEMRKAQLEIRQAEVLEAAHVLQQINEGKGEEVASSSTRSVDAKARLSDWKGRLDLKNLWALGHSFGGATSIELIRRPDTIFTHALVLDPWMEAVAKAGQGPPIQKPLFVINSEAFTIWRGNFTAVRGVVQESYRNSGKGWLMTMTKTGHTDFSDFPLLMPRFFKNKSGVPSQSLVSLFSQASRMEFVGDFNRERLTFPVRDETEGELDKKDLGEGGRVVWHPIDSKASSIKL
jgi:platelet-activating factor acetylhydrolase